MSVNAVVHGNNADLIEQVCRLYLQGGEQVADLTYGKGVFWRKVPQVNVTGSDLVTTPNNRRDFTATGYDADSFDVVVLDPPYIHNPGNHTTDHRYQNKETTKGFYHADIRRLYVDGMREARRILRPGGQLWVKCKDQVESGVQRWSHCELLAEAHNLGLFGRDLFVLIATSRTPNSRWKTQKHARKPHSFLWVFEEPHGKEIAAINRARALDSLKVTTPVRRKK